MQVLVASEDQKKQKSGEEDKKKASRSSKDVQAKNPLESHVEMDSRILSALLTVSILFIFFKKYTFSIEFNVLFFLS